MTENITIKFFLVLDTVLFTIRVSKFGINAFLRQPILQGILCRYSRGHAFTWHHRPTVNTRPIPQYVHIDRFPLLLFDLIKRWQDSPNPINATSSERAPQITRRQSSSGRVCRNASGRNLRPSSVIKQISISARTWWAAICSYCSMLLLQNFYHYYDVK